MKPFTSDGCSLFPDASPITKANWCSCCVEHDISYWRGGTEKDRQLADTKLKDCVLSKTGNKTLSSAMYEGVRVGGSPYFYTWYRWGYAWDFNRKYQALTENEQDTAERLLADYLANHNKPVCGKQ